MHRIVAVILAFLYFGTTSGMVLNVHYCMGKIASVEFDNFNESENNTLNLCGKTSKKCCRDEVKIIKNTEVHKQISDDQGIVKTFGVAVSPNFYIQYVKPVSLSKKQLTAYTSVYSPPDIYLKNCVFRI